MLSDIHGFYTLLRQTLHEAGYDSDPGEKRLLLLGDLLDRGREPEEMQDFLLSGLESDQLILIRGNHEDLFAALVTEDHGRALRHHVHNGTYETLQRLTGLEAGSFLCSGRALAQAGRATPFYLRILPATLDYYETPHYIFTHGWLPSVQEDGQWRYEPDWREAEPERWRRARWLNGMDAARCAYPPGKTVVCGHVHCSYGHWRYEGKGSEYGPDADFSPYRAPGVIALDACTAISGKMNCLVIED